MVILLACQYTIKFHPFIGRQVWKTQGPKGFVNLSSFRRLDPCTLDHTLMAVANQGKISGVESLAEICGHQQLKLFYL